jgi:hypothetical protein
MPKEVAVGSRKKLEEDASLLRHLINSLDEAEKKLEEFYEKNDPDNFNKTKKFILHINQKISEISR